MRTKDLDKIKCIKSEHNKVPVKHKEINKRWKRSCNKLFSDNKNGDIGRQRRIVGL